MIARRLIAERCLYGVDLNPLAVELAKLAIWLVTMAKGRPFGFLDHNLRCGDSLLGIYRLDQLTELSVSPSGKGQQRLFGRNIEQAIHEAIELRKQLREMPIRDIHDVEAMARLDVNARHRLEVPERIADAFIGEVFSRSGSGTDLETALSSLSVRAGQAVEGHGEALNAIRDLAKCKLSVDLPTERSARRTFHWPLAFPEVLSRQNAGFDAIVGNPPFLGGKRISTVMGTSFNAYLAGSHPGASKNTDLVAHFFRRAYDLLRMNGCFGLLATNTIAEGDTRQGGLEWMLQHGATIYAAWPNEPWPGAAAVITSRVHVFRGVWQGPRTLVGSTVTHISAFLSAQEDWTPRKLQANEGKAFIGSLLNGIREAKEWDADLLNRSVMEGSLKYVYMLLGTPEEIHMKVKEYWEILPKFSDIKHSERADRLISKLPKSDSLEWQPFRDLVLRDEEIDALRKEYTRAQRQELEERWSFSGISKQFMQSENAGLQLFGGMAHGYGMSSHLLHKDADGIGMVWERTKRSPHRQAAVTLGHAARVVSDVCTFAQLRLLYLLKLCGGDTSCIRELENDYTLLFKQLKNANTQFNWVEYGPMPNGDISENKK